MPSEDTTNRHYKSWTESVWPERTKFEAHRLNIIKTREAANYGKSKRSKQRRKQSKQAT